MNGWPARSAASRKTHPKHIHPGRGAFCAPAVFAAGEMRLNGSKGRGASIEATARSLAGVASTLLARAVAPRFRSQADRRGLAGFLPLGTRARRSRDRNGKTARGGQSSGQRTRWFRASKCRRLTLSLRLMQRHHGFASASQKPRRLDILPGACYNFN